MATSVEIPLRDTDEVSGYFLNFCNFKTHAQIQFAL